MEIEQLENIIVTSEDLTKILPIKNRNYISELVREHNLPKLDHNKYPLIEFIRAYVLYQNRLCEDRVEKIRKEKPSDYRDRIVAELKELELLEKKKELISIAEVLGTYLRTNEIIIGQIDGLAAKVAPQLLGIDNLKSMVEKLKEITNNLRDNISSQLMNAAKKYEDDSKVFEPEK